MVACGAPQSVGPSAATVASIERAEAAQAARQYQRARAYYQQAEEHAPDGRSRAFAAAEHGRALAFWGEHAAAATALERAAAADPTDASVWHDLGIIRHQRGDVDGAIRALHRAIALAPKEPRPRIALAALLWRHQHLRAALAQYRALRHLPLPERLRVSVDWAIARLTGPQAPAADR